nr:hypothetical protein [Streptomyces odonnellii]
MGDFEGDSYGGVTVKKADIKQRALTIAVPQAINQDQMNVLEGGKGEAKRVMVRIIKMR